MHAIPHTRGKVYELYCVARLLAELSAKGVTASFSSPGPLVFRKSGGHADPAFPHFDLCDATGVFGCLYTDIEVRTLGAAIGHVGDLSAYHEIDVVVLIDGHQRSPLHSDLLIGLECKAVADFDKAFVREALGRRRELSFYGPGKDPFEDPIMADPGCWYRLCYIDGRGDRYKQSPAMFGVELHHWLPSAP